MRILLLGKNGQLGWELQRCLAPLGQIIALDYPDFDISQPDSIRKTFLESLSDIIINATAYTAVDKAESEPDLAQAINANGPGILAELALTHRKSLIHYSTDYVFDGSKGSPYTEMDRPNPLNVYGQSKLAGEQAIIQIDPACLILRTSWVYSSRRESFVTKVLGWARTQKDLQIVNDQIGNPTWARMLAEATTQLLVMGTSAGHDSPQLAQSLSFQAWLYEHRGLYHLAGEGYASRFEWAKAILELTPHRQEQFVPQIQPALTSQFSTPAQRPLFSALNCEHFSQVFGLRLPHWKQALEFALLDSLQPL